MTIGIVLNITTVIWVAKTLEECFHSAGSKEFIKTFKHGDTAYIAQRSFNVFGSFLYLIEFRGGCKRGLIIIPEEVVCHGWMKMAEELRVLCGSGNKKFKRDVSLSQQQFGDKSYAEVVRAPSAI